MLHSIYKMNRCFYSPGFFFLSFFFSFFLSFFFLSIFLFFLAQHVEFMAGKMQMRIAVQKLIFEEQAPKNDGANELVGAHHRFMRS